MAILNFMHARVRFADIKRSACGARSAWEAKGPTFGTHVLLTKAGLVGETERERARRATMSNALFSSRRLFARIRLVHHRCAGTKVEKGRNHVLEQRKVGARIHFQMAFEYIFNPALSAAIPPLRNCV
jgi:hypothetical protein